MGVGSNLYGLVSFLTKQILNEMGTKKRVGLAARTRIQFAGH